MNIFEPLWDAAASTEVIVTEISSATLTLDKGQWFIHVPFLADGGNPTCVVSQRLHPRCRKRHLPSHPACVFVLAARCRPEMLDPSQANQDMSITHITVRGARQHNLRDVSVSIPRNTLTVVTGLSGSGKSSLAFDTIYAEGQRRYVETLSAYARQFLDQMERPDVDSIDGLSPAISIEQKTTSRSAAFDRRHHHRRSTTTCGCCMRAWASRTALIAACRSRGRPRSRSCADRGAQPARRESALRCWRRWCAGARASSAKRLRRWTRRATGCASTARSSRWKRGCGWRSARTTRSKRSSTASS